MNVRIDAFNFFAGALLSLVIVNGVNAQSNGDYRSKTANTSTWSWNTASNWEVFSTGTGLWSTASVPPNSTSVVVTLQATTASPSNTVVNGSTAVTSTGTLVINSGVSLNIGAVNFILNNITLNGGTLKGASSKPLVVKGDFTIDATNGGVFNGNGGTVDFQGTTTLSGGTASIASNSFSFANVLITNTLNLGSSYIKIGGTNFTNGASGTFNGGFGTVEFNSPLTDQNINSSSTMIFNDILINNNFNNVFNFGSDTRLSGTLSFSSSAGIFHADGDTPGSFNFTLLSSGLAGGGRIAAVLNTNVSGTVNIQRFIDGKASGDYRYVSMPVQGGFAGPWKSAFGVTGNFSDPSTHAEFSTIVDAGKTTASVYSWNPVTQAYVALSGGPTTTVANTPVPDLTGFAIFDFSTLDATATYTGPIESGDVQVAISPTAGNFNLVPNPYPCPIGWDTIAADNNNIVGATMWWRTANHVYSSYNHQIGVPPGDPSQGKIAIGQAFWTMSASGAAGAGSVMTFKEQHKTPGQDPAFVRKESVSSAGSYFLFKLASSTQTDYTAIRFINSATDDLDFEWDAVKRRNGEGIKYINLSTFTVAASKDYSINSIAEVNGCSKTIGVKVADVVAGNHTLNFEDFSKMQLPYNIVLIDHFLNKENKVSQGFTYPFSVTSDANSYGNARFEIRFEKILVQPVVSAQGQTLTSSISTGNQWYKDGQIIAGATNSTYNATASGVYFVKTTSGGCETTSDNLTLSITGLEEVATSSMIYPNPTQGIVTIKLPPDLDASLTGVYLYDVQGNVVLSSEKDSSLLKEGEKSLDLTNFKGGVYILNIASGSQVKSIRLMKK